MNIIKTTAILLIALPFYAGAQMVDNDSILKILDKETTRKHIYEASKLEKTDRLKKLLAGRSLSVVESYFLTSLLTDEYKYYISDSARKYAESELTLAQLLKSELHIAETKIKLSEILASQGMFAQSFDMLDKICINSLDTDLISRYYSTKRTLFLFNAQYLDDEIYSKAFIDSMNRCGDSVLKYTPQSAFDYKTLKALKLSDKNPKEANRIMTELLQTLTPDTREYSMASAISAYIYMIDNDSVMCQKSLAVSAISDIRACVKENSSIIDLSELLFKKGMTERADNYVNSGIEDAAFFNSRLRNLQASRILPLIAKTYADETELRRKRTETFLWFTAVTALLLFAVALFAFRQRRRTLIAEQNQKTINQSLLNLNDELNAAGKTLESLNKSLNEANKIKEEYIGRFLGLCSEYVKRLEDYRKLLNKKAAAGKTSELFAAIKSDDIITQSTELLCKNFDTAFLNIFPGFIDKFNALLRSDEILRPKADEKLSVELRIFALIRLGITDSATIAGFLRYSVTTIYTYRSKIRNKAVDHDSFEDNVKNIV